MVPQGHFITSGDCSSIKIYSNRLRLRLPFHFQQLVPRVVRLRQDRRYGNVACVRRQHLPPGRVEGAQERRRREGQLQRVEVRLCLRGPRESCSGAAQCRHLHCKLCVALHEAAVVVGLELGQPIEASYFAARRWGPPENQAHYNDTTMTYNDLQ
jgi:hypothetical protein